MTIQNLLEKLAQNNIKIKIKNEKLSIKFPKDQTLPPEITEEIKKYRDELFKLLSGTKSFSKKNRKKIFRIKRWILFFKIKENILFSPSNH